MRFNNSGGNGNGRLIKFGIITMFIFVGYNVVVRTSISSSRTLDDIERADMFVNYQQNQGVFSNSGYDNQAPAELYSQQYTPNLHPDSPYLNEQHPMAQTQLRGSYPEVEMPTMEIEGGLSIFPAAPKEAIEALNQEQQMSQFEDYHSLGDTSISRAASRYYDHKATDADVYAPIAGSVSMKIQVGEYEEIFSLDYYHCGPTYTLGAIEDGDEAKIIHEIILLHGAKFTKEDWKSSGILEKLCDHETDEEDKASNVYFSVVAADLAVTADGLQLAHAFEALTTGGVISGMPATFVTPSASGRCMVDLAEVSRSANEDVVGEVQINLLQSMVQAWIPFAPPAVKDADTITLNEFAKGNIPVLAMYGFQDAMGKQVSDKLEAEAGAKAMVVGENHPGYLDKPDKFVSSVKLFIKNLDTWFVEEEQNF